MIRRSFFRQRFKLAIFSSTSSFWLIAIAKDVFPLNIKHTILYNNEWDHLLSSCVLKVATELRHLKLEDFSRTEAFVVYRDFDSVESSVENFVFRLYQSSKVTTSFFKHHYIIPALRYSRISVMFCFLSIRYFSLKKN